MALLLESDSDEELPQGWEARSAEDGRIYYVDHNRRATQWEHPKSGQKKRVTGELPFGWEKKTDKEGHVFFIDLVNKRSTYIDPRVAFGTNTSAERRKKFVLGCSATYVLQGEDLTGKVAIITGANSGIGYETARALALYGARVILACRDFKKAQDAAARISKGQEVELKVEPMVLNLASLQSIKKFSDDFKQLGCPLHMLICNAAIYNSSRKETIDRIEETFGVNHVGHFYLVQELKDVLVKSKPSRIVVVTSEAHRYLNIDSTTKLDIAELALKGEKYWGIEAYNQSKLCNILFMVEQNRRLEEHGVTVNCVHPGNMIYTNMAKRSYWLWPLYIMTRPFTKSASQGAAAVVNCATSKTLNGVSGLYYNGFIYCEPSTEATNSDRAKQLWDFTERLVKEKLDWTV